MCITFFPIREKRRQSVTASLNTDEAHPLLAAGVKGVNLAFAYLFLSHEFSLAFTTQNLILTSNNRDRCDRGKTAVPPNKCYCGDTIVK